MQNDKKIKISVAGNRKSINWVTQELLWSDFIKRINAPVVTGETFEEFIKFPKSKQDELKDVGGFVAGTLKDNRRKASNVIERYLVTLDADTIEAGNTDNVLKRVKGLGCAYAVYSTRKHCSAKPRLRIIIPLDKSVKPDEYEAIARKIASLIGLEIMDPSTFEPSRLMYWPSHSSNSEFVFQYEDKAFASATGLLAMYKNWKDFNEWPKFENETEAISREIKKQKDPAEKAGLVGAFCKVYDIHSLIAKYLQDVYEPGNADDKYTYVSGTVANGATTYEDNKFLYSYHATDPATRTLCNSFDLVRIHKFSSLDEEAKPNTPPTQLPSFKAMCEFALEDEDVSRAYRAEKFSTAVEEFDSKDETTPQKNWQEELVLTQEGNLAKCAKNVLIILENDPNLKDKLLYDRFTGRFLVKGKLPWDYQPKTDERTWTDGDEACLRNYLDNKDNNYNFKGPSLIRDALCELKMKKSTHVVQDYLNSITWDGKLRLDTLLIDYLGCENSEYAKQIMRKTIVAAVARSVEEKPIKFDNMPILVGPQGVGKSTFLKKIGGKWFTDSITTFEGKDSTITMQRCLIVEIAELAAFGRMETNRLKQVISSESDLFREPYDREAKEHPRHCVFFGTTNDNEFLKDRTGNRRYWPINTNVTKPTKSVFNDFTQEEVDQIWAEAFVRFKIGEKLYLEGEALRQAVIQQEEHRESSVWEGLIQEFVDKKVPTDWNRRSLSERRDFWTFQTGKEEVDLIPRDRICSAEIWCECLKNELKTIRLQDTKEINSILNLLSGFEKTSTARFGPYGTQRGFVKTVYSVYN